MRIDRFFVEDVIGTQTQIHVSDPRVVHKWRKVLRYTPGDEVVLCDNTGTEYRGRLMDFTTANTPAGKREAVTVEILAAREGRVPDRDLTLYMAVIKKDLFELVVEKATELGVSRIVPMRTEYTGQQNLRYDRLEKIIREASEQSERAILPEIDEETEVPDVIETASAGLRVLTARDHDGNARMYTGRETITGLMVGPEGGWSEAEMALFTEHAIPHLSLGEQILRAETAAISGIACICCVRET